MSMDFGIYLHRPPSLVFHQEVILWEMTLQSPHIQRFFHNKRKTTMVYVRLTGFTLHLQSTL